MSGKFIVSMRKPSGRIEYVAVASIEAEMIGSTSDPEGAATFESRDDAMSVANLAMDQGSWVRVEDIYQYEP